MSKISIIGAAGNIGGQLANLLNGTVSEIVMCDIDPDKAQAKALDIMQAGVLEGKNTKMFGTDDYSNIQASDAIIVSAGLPRQSSMGSRDDLLRANAKIIEIVAQNIKKYAPEAFVVIITNPLDAMVWLTNKIIAGDHRKVVGMAGVLDSARFRLFLAHEFQVSVEEVQAIVCGEHGHTMMPIIEYSTVAGIPIPKLIEQGLSSWSRINEIIERTRNGGAEIVSLLKNGSAYYAPAMSAVTMVKSYLNDERRLLSCAAYLNGEFGIQDLYVGVPVIIGKNGVEKIVEIPLSGAEKEKFTKSVQAVRKTVDKLQ